MSKGKWELKPHFHQIADTGDYDGHYEITNGKISLITNDDDEEAVQPIVDALNNSGCKFYENHPAEIENHIMKYQMQEKDQLLQECRTALKAIKEVAETVHSDNPNEVAYYKEAIALLTKLQSINTK